MPLHNSYFNKYLGKQENDGNPKWHATSLISSLKLIWKFNIEVMSLHNPYFDLQLLGRQENGVQFQHSTKTALLCQKKYLTK